jgi:hypothetical protein
MGRETFDSLMDLYRSYHDFRREAQSRAKTSTDGEAPLDLPEPVRQLYMSDLAVIDFVIGLVRRASRKANDPESPAGKKLADCHHVDETFNMVKAQLKGFRAFVARVKADPKSVMEQLGEKEEEGDDNSDDE